MGRRLGRCVDMGFGRRLFEIEVKECWIDWNIDLVVADRPVVWVLEAREYSGPYAVSRKSESDDHTYC